MLELGKILIIGIAITTSNQDGSAQKDIPEMWQKFYTQEVLKSIPNRVNDKIYAVYTNYQGDYTAPYDLVIGCAVNTLDEVPEGLEALTIDAADYKKFTVDGENPQQSVVQTWMKIWRSDLKRSYQADFELYEYNEANELEVSVYIGVDE